MTIETLSFQYGNGVTTLGFIGLILTSIIIVTTFVSYYNSPLRK